jgi:hypothetical protein
VIQEFHLSITPVGQDCYWLRTEAVAPGVPLAEAQLTWPVDRWLQQTASLFQDPLQQLLQPPPAEPPYHGEQEPSGQNPIWLQLGQSLYHHLFQGRIRDSWLAAQGVAQHRGQTLRLRLGFKDSRLQRLPWELLYGEDRPLATGIDLSLCRYYRALGNADTAAMPDLPQRDEAIHVLVVIAAPGDQERLSLRHEVQTLIEDLTLRQGQYPGENLNKEGKSQSVELRLTILEQPGRPELAHALEQGQFQVFHYAGHSDVNTTGGELYLVNRQTGLTDWLSGEDLAGLLVNNGIRLAVFNSCRGAYTAADDTEAGWREQNLVQALVNRGVPGVIAMAERIPDDVAVTFTRLLYGNLQRGYAIDLCLSRVRQGLISAYRSDQPFWMLPILYLHPDFDGYLYVLPDADQTSLELTGLTESGRLVPPDYSTDPDISGLAQEVFAGHSTTALPPLESKAVTPQANASYAVSSVGAEVEEQQPDSSEASPSPSADLLDELEHHGKSASVVETAAVSKLIQQLSQSDQSWPTASESQRDASVKDENLLPDWPHPSTDLEDQFPEDPNKSQINAKAGAKSAFPWQPSDSRIADNSPRFPLPTRLPGNLVIWVGLGIVSFLVVTALAVTTLMRSSHTRPLEGTLPPLSNRADSNPPADSDLSPSLGGRDSPVITEAIAALTEDKPATAATFINQLLDQGDTEAAAGVLGSARNEQLMEPELAFVRGRLAWQESITGRGLGTAYDAQRDWTTAVKAKPDFLEAWVALGFANYTLGAFDGALKAWQRAAEIDRSRLQDTDPAGQRRFADEATLDAYAGLAMVNQKLGELNPVERDKTQYQQRAKAYFDQVTSIDPLRLDPETLAIDWIWSPDLIKSWQTTVERVTTLE